MEKSNQTNRTCCNEDVNRTTSKSSRRRRVAMKKTSWTNRVEEDELQTREIVPVAMKKTSWTAEEDELDKWRRMVGWLIRIGFIWCEGILGIKKDPIPFHWNNWGYPRNEQIPYMWNLMECIHSIPSKTANQTMEWNVVKGMPHSNSIGFHQKERTKRPLTLFLI